MASLGNRHCANCIDTLSFPIGHAHSPAAPATRPTSYWLALGTAAKLGRLVLNT